uniref:Uncharacterized protein n=1 Tax=Panagrolaimus sp. JU765 TaxID=591449 RepID=A0AC34QDB5_9BILA
MNLISAIEAEIQEIDEKILKTRRMVKTYSAFVLPGIEFFANLFEQMYLLAKSYVTRTKQEIECGSENLLKLQSKKKAEIQEIDEKILKTRRMVKTYSAFVLPGIEFFANLFEQMYLLAKSYVTRTKQEIECGSENLLKLQSKKSRLLNPVTLDPGLYVDILKASNEQLQKDSEDKHVTYGEILKFFSIGKEPSEAFMDWLKTTNALNFKFNLDFKKSGDDEDALLRFNYLDLDGLENVELLDKMFEVVAPFVTFVDMSNFHPNRFQTLFFKHLGINPKQRRIVFRNLFEVDETMFEAISRLCDKHVGIEFHGLSPLVLMDLPPRKYDFVRFDYINDEFFEFLHDCSWTCERIGFETLERLEHRPLSSFQEDLRFDFVKEIILYDMDYEDIQGSLHLLSILFPYAEKINGKFFFIYDFHRVNEKVKKIIADAPQKEVLLMCNHYCTNQQEMNEIIGLFDGKQVAEHVYHWNPKNDELKTIQLILNVADDPFET